MTFLKRAAMLACVLPIAAASGCTGTDVLSTGNSAFTIAVEIVNPMTRHDFALFSITAINVRPNEPSADEALGQNPIAVIASAADLIDVDLNDVTQFDPTTIRLSTGSYRINRLEMAKFQFVDFQAPIPAASCAELIQYPAISRPVAITPADLGSTDLIVTEGGAGELSIKIDGAALVEAYQNSWTDCDLFGGSNPNDYEFDEDLFAAAASTFISLQ